MKISRYVVAVCTVAALAAASRAKDMDTSPADDSAQDRGPQTIKWLTYGEAAAKAKKENKHIMIDFTRKGCPWCRKMEQDTYTNPDVIKLVNEEFAPVKVWGDSKEEVEVEGYRISQRALAIQEFGVSGYPQFWFVTPAKLKVGPLKGYLPADRFMNALNWVKDRRYDTTAVRRGDPEKGTKE